MFGKYRFSIVFSFVLIASLVGSLFIASASLQRSAPAGLAAPNGVQPPAASSLDAAQPQADAAVTVISIPSSNNDVSPALRDMTPLAPQPRFREEEANENQPLPIQGHTDARDTVVQRTFSPTNDPNAPVPLLAGPLGGFAGINAAGSGCNCAPPDTNGDVGPNNYVQTVNTAFAVYSKTGTLLYGPAAINTIWSGFGGPCQTRNDGDPVALYDSMADRWLISQFTAASPYNQCVAISTTGDPTGTGSGGPGYKFADEKVTRDYLPGTLAMANSGPNTNGSQFFITLADLTASLPKKYTIFGIVTSGFDVVQKIGNVPVTRSPSMETSLPTVDVHIDTISIQEK